MNLWGNWILDLSHWFTLVAFSSTFKKFPLKEAWKIWLQMIWSHLRYVAIRHDCLTAGKIATSHEGYTQCLRSILWHSYLNLLNFGVKTIIEIWSFSDKSCPRSTHCSHKTLSTWNPMFCKQLQMKCEEVHHHRIM